MFRQFFRRREGASPAAKPARPGTRRSRRSRPGLENLEGRQLLSLGAPFQVDSPSQPAAAKATVVSATNANGWSVDAWVEQPVLANSKLGPMEIRAQLFNANGAKVGPEIVAAASGQGFNSYQPVRVDGPAG